MAWNAAAVRGAAVLFSLGVCAMASGQNYTNNILITGYWPPTNNMLRQFSTNPASNPSGWVGGNWEGRGFNIHAHFPEFPGLVGPNWGAGSGELRVDYQDTTRDFQRLTEELRPVAIITFSRGNATRSWEPEPAAQRFRLPGETNPLPRSVPLYTNDYDANPYRDPRDQPIANEPIGNVRLSTLPIQGIIDAVGSALPQSQIRPFVDPLWNPDNYGSGYDFGGGFLSGYISYLGLWYHDLNSGPDAEFRNFAAGHIHVGLDLDPLVAAHATEITLRTLIEHLNVVIPTPGTAGLLAMGALAAGRRRRTVPGA